MHFNAFARLTSSDAFRLHSPSPSEAHPVHAACFLVSLVLSPLGFSCVCLCGPRVWRTCAHSHACWGILCILTHNEAVMKQGADSQGNRAVPAPAVADGRQLGGRPHGGVLRPAPWRRVLPAGGREVRPAGWSVVYYSNRCSLLLNAF